MCLACEQDAMWFAYLRRRGLIDENGMPTEPVPNLADPFETLATEEEKEQRDAQKQLQQNAAAPADKDKFSCDDPAG